MGALQTLVRWQRISRQSKPVHVADLREARMELHPGVSLFAAAEATPTYTALIEALGAAGFDPGNSDGLS